MAGKSNTLSKKSIIAIIVIIVLLLIAGISVGIFLADKGQTEAVDGNETNQIDTGSQSENNNNEQPENTIQPDNLTINPDSEDGNEENPTTTDEGENDNEITEDEFENNQDDADITTNTNVNEVGETTITRVEEQDRLVSEDFVDWWAPIDVTVAATMAKIAVETPDISIAKNVTTETGDNNLTYVGQKLFYELIITNNGKNDIENIEVTDKIPENTTFVSFNDDEESEFTKSTIKTTDAEGNETVVGVKWLVSIPGHKDDEDAKFVKVKFIVTVNETMLNENGEEVKNQGTLLNTGIANGEESNETRTSIIEAKKSSTVIRRDENDGSEKVVETAKIGDIITYTITVTNTGTESGKVKIEDAAPKGTKLISAQELQIAEGQTTVVWEDVELPANSEITREFVVEVVTIDKEIRNIATVSDKDTNEDIIQTADIKIVKTVENIKRGNEDLGPNVAARDGDIIEYAIVVTNIGSVDLTNVVVTDYLPGIELNLEDLIIGDLAVGESSEIIRASYKVTYDVDIKNNADRTVINEVDVVGETVVKPDPENPEETPEPETVTDEDDVTTPIEEMPLIQLTKTTTAVRKSTENEFKEVTDTTTVRPGDVVEFTILVENTGNVELTDIVVTDSLEVKVNSENEESKKVDETTNVSILCTIQSLAVGATAEPIKVYYTVTETDLEDNVDKIYNVAYAKASEGPEDSDDADIPENPNVDIDITKVWNDQENRDGVRPSTITVKLFANGGTTPVRTETFSGTSFTFENLPKYDYNKQEIIYTVAEDTVANYITTYSDDTLTITNTHVPAKTQVPVEKKWEDGNNQDGIRPTLITVKLLSNGKEVKSIELNEANSWKYTFTDLYEYENGIKINYTVEEVGIENIDYTSETTGNATDGYIITNTHIPEITEVSVEKKWEDENNQDGIRPTSITVRLLANEAEVKSIELNEANSWKHTFIDLPVNESGTKINYTVEEVGLENIDYTSETTGNAIDGYIITNTHIPSTVDVPVIKVWENDGNGETRPEKLNIQLYADGVPVEGKKVELTAAINWSYTFEELPEYSNGTKINYTAKEEAVPNGYSANESGTTITNIYLVPTKTVNKTEAQIGEVLTYKVSLKNNGTKNLQGVILTDTVDTTKLEIVNKGGATLLSDGKTLQWTLNINAGQTITKTFTAKIKDVDLGTVIKNTAFVNGNSSNEVQTTVIKIMETTAISRTGKNIVVVLDLSSSMLKRPGRDDIVSSTDLQSKLAKAKVAVNGFFDSVLQNERNTITLITFNYDTYNNAKKGLQYCDDKYGTVYWPMANASTIKPYIGTKVLVDKTNNANTLKTAVNNIRLEAPLLTNVVAALELTKQKVNTLKTQEPNKEVEVVFIGDGKPSYSSEPAAENSCGFYNKETTFKKITDISTEIKKKAEIYTVEYAVPDSEKSDATKTFTGMSSGSDYRFEATESNLASKLAEIGKAFTETTIGTAKSNVDGKTEVQIINGGALDISEKTPVTFKFGSTTKKFKSEAEITTYYNSTGIIKYDSTNRKFIIDGNKIDRHKDSTISLTYYYYKD